MLSAERLERQRPLSTLFICKQCRQEKKKKEKRKLNTAAIRQTIWDDWQSFSRPQNILFIVSIWENCWKLRCAHFILFFVWLAARCLPHYVASKSSVSIPSFQTISFSSVLPSTISLQLFFFLHKLNNIFVNEMLEKWPPFALMTLWRRFERGKKDWMENVNIADDENRWQLLPGHECHKKP